MRIKIILLCLILILLNTGCGISRKFINSNKPSSNTFQSVMVDKPSPSAYEKKIKQLEDLSAKKPYDIKVTEDLATTHFEYAIYLVQEVIPKENDATKREISMNIAGTEFSKTIPLYEKVIKKQPDNVQSIGDLASCYYYLNMPEKAIEYDRLALKVKPDYTIVRINLAKTLVNWKEDYKGAIQELNKVPKNDELYQDAQKLIGSFENKLIEKNNSQP